MEKTICWGCETRYFFEVNVPIDCILTPLDPSLKKHGRGTEIPDGFVRQLHAFSCDLGIIALGNG